MVISTYEETGIKSEEAEARADLREETHESGREDHTRKSQRAAWKGATKYHCTVTLAEVAKRTRTMMGSDCKEYLAIMEDHDSKCGMWLAAH